MRDAVIFLFGAVFFVYDLTVGLRAGNVRLLYIRVKKEDHPILFWYGVVLSIFLIVVSLASLGYCLSRVKGGFG